MLLFSEWIKLHEISPGKGMGTQRPKPVKSGIGARDFVANTSQYWGPSATFGHRPSKPQTMLQKGVAGPISAVGERFRQKLGRDPGQIPTIEWEGIGKQFTDLHVTLDETMPLMLAAHKSPQCQSGSLSEEQCEIAVDLMEDFHPTGEHRGAKENVVRAKQFMTQEQDSYVALYPDLTNPQEELWSVNFTRALIQAHMWDTLVKDKLSTKVDFNSAKWTPQINGGEKSMTLIGSFPKIGADIAGRAARELAHRGTY
jgi:cytochrome c-type biogenesis protein CcmH/NrfF